MKFKNITKLFSTIALSAALLATQAFAGSPMINSGASTEGGGEGLAISGYDAVAYFTESMPVEGNAEFSLEHEGAMWQFASMENLEMFKADPASYAPQYGGYCAYAIAKGKTKSIDPAAWKIIDNKLYLNHTMDVQKKWLKDTDAGIAEADSMWPSVLN